MISLYGARELSYHVMVGYGFALVRIGSDWLAGLDADSKDRS
jgi:hypothetical protein